MGPKKVQAFTLSEMLVVLLLTIIVVGLAFSILGLVQKQMFGIQENYEHKTAGNLLRQALWVDFNSHSQIMLSEKTGSIQLSNEMGGMYYSFYEDYIVRDLDTIYTDFKLGKLYFEGDEVFEGSIDALELSTDGEKENNKRIFVYKKNAAADFMN
ncbi:type II secretion system protein J [Flagellimonas sp. S3867]|uniref:PulJ/GspJ family protein n=1 Tax=Flagellimonas sp. S3867 TaxID=2768063 RepID=UPI001685B9F8|nr:type II secretion system protein [Flagellimonas sp. S3867]